MYYLVVCCWYPGLLYEFIFHFFIRYLSFSVKEMQRLAPHLDLSLLSQLFLTNINPNRKNINTQNTLLIFTYILLI